MVSKFVNILNKKKGKGNKSDTSVRVIVAAVCHVTNMTRRHGNVKGERSKITVALKNLTMGTLGVS